MYPLYWMPLMSSQEGIFCVAVMSIRNESVGFPHGLNQTEETMSSWTGKKSQVFIKRKAKISPEKLYPSQGIVLITQCLAINKNYLDALTIENKEKNNRPLNFVD